MKHAVFSAVHSLETVPGPKTCAIAVLLVAGCSDSETVARVGEEKISEERVEQFVEHFEEEFQREGNELVFGVAASRMGSRRAAASLLALLPAELEA